MTSLELAKRIMDVLDGAKAADVRCYDVRGKSPITDFFIVATGLSSPHLRAVVSSVRAAMSKEGVPSYRNSGEPDSGWVVLDYVDVVVHAFTHEAREYYDLDGLWKDSPRIKADGEV